MGALPPIDHADRFVYHCPEADHVLATQRRRHRPRRRRSAASASCLRRVTSSGSTPAGTRWAPSIAGSAPPSITRAAPWVRMFEAVYPQLRRPLHLPRRGQGRRGRRRRRPAGSSAPGAPAATTPAASTRWPCSARTTTTSSSPPAPRSPSRSGRCSPPLRARHQRAHDARRRLPRARLPRRPAVPRGSREPPRPATAAGSPPSR